MFIKPITLLVSTFILFTSTITFAQSTQVTKAIAESADLITPLMNGQYVPSTIEVTTLSGKKRTLADVLNNQKTILFFYRGGWCPFCNTQMGQLKKIEPKLSKLGFQLIGISTDNEYDLQKSVGKHKLNYQLLADFNSTTSQAFGLAFYASQSVTDRYLAAMNLKNPLQKNAAGNERLVLPAPAIYIVDKQGLVQFNYVNTNYKVRLHEELLLKAAQLVK
ncbi:MAG: AhpC/TSA family protein [Colwellia sp.]|nr:AhpC/TSA family protein [Colwellia sp.]MCW8864761.1 AhpC/TSA family protein [Colwellia sp.]MCW9081868.1 AhpC/TSA family protein [Colwellia sp.]